MGINQSYDRSEPKATPVPLDHWHGQTIAQALPIARRVAAGDVVRVRAGTPATLAAFALTAAGIVESHTVRIGNQLWHQLTRRAGR
jgi:hypothetical protein